MLYVFENDAVADWVIIIIVVSALGMDEKTFVCVAIIMHTSLL